MSRHSPFRPAQALYRILAESHSTLLRSLQHQIPNARRVVIQCNQRAYRSTSTASAPAVRKEKWNEEITAREIYVVDPATGKLGSPISPRDVLQTLNMEKQRLIQLVPDRPGDQNFKPICKIVDRQLLYNVSRRRKEQNKEAKHAKSAGGSLKTIELNWAIGQNDLNHRMVRMKQFLKEGRKVEVVLAAKKRGRRATIEECQALLGQIRTAVDATTGAREFKTMEGHIGDVAMLTFQGTINKPDDNTTVEA